jgi:hypothetical protein
VYNIAIKVNQIFKRKEANMADNNGNGRFETCLVCGTRSRKKGCLICIGCETRFNKFLGRSANALVSCQYEKVLPINDKFQFVIDMAEGNFPDPDNPNRAGTMEMLEERAIKAENNVEKQKDYIWAEAQKEIENRCVGQNIGQAVFDKAVDSLFFTKSSKDEDLQVLIRKAHGYRKAFELAKEQLDQIKKKRADFLVDQAQKEEAVAV